MFPRGGIELAEYFYESSNQRLAEKLAEQVESLNQDNQKLVSQSSIHSFELMYNFSEMGLLLIQQNPEVGPYSLFCRDCQCNQPDRSDDSSRIMGVI